MKLVIFVRSDAIWTNGFIHASGTRGYLWTLYVIQESSFQRSHELRFDISVTDSVNTNPRNIGFPLRCLVR